MNFKKKHNRLTFNEMFLEKEEKAFLISMKKLLDDDHNTSSSEEQQKIFFQTVNEAMIKSNPEGYRTALEALKTVNINVMVQQNETPQFRIVSMIHENYNIHSANVKQSFPKLKKPAVLKEFLANFTSFVLGIPLQTRSYDKDDQHTFEEQIVGLVAESFRTINPIKKDTDGLLEDKSDFLPKLENQAQEKGNRTRARKKATNNRRQNNSTPAASTIENSNLANSQVTTSPNLSNISAVLVGKEDAPCKSFQLSVATLQNAASQAHTVESTSQVSSPVSLPCNAPVSATSTEPAHIIEAEFCPQPLTTEQSQLPITVMQNAFYRPTRYEEYVRSGGVNRQRKKELYEEHLYQLKTRGEPSEKQVGTTVFNAYELEFLTNIIFGSKSKWSLYKWSDIEGLLKKAGWELDDTTGSSSIRFTPRRGLHEVIGSHSISIHGAHNPSQKPAPTYCIDFLKRAFKNSYGISQADIN